MHGSIDYVVNAVEGFSDVAWPSVGALVVIGVLTSALIQLAKDLLPIRRIYNVTQISLWLSATKSVKSGEKRKLKEFRSAVIDLATAGSAANFYRLRPRHLAGQIAAAAQLAVDDPENFRIFLKLISDDADEVDTVAKLISDERNDDLEEAKRMAFGRDLARARARLASRIQRRIDALQIELETGWAVVMHVASVGVSCVLVFTAALQYGFLFGNALLLIGVALVAGFLASVSHSITSALANIGRNG